MTETRKPGRFLAFLKWTGITVAGLAGLALVLNLTTGMHLQMTGNFMPQLDFHDEDRHYRALEAHRDRSAEVAPAPDPEQPEPTEGPDSDNTLEPEADAPVAVASTDLPEDPTQPDPPVEEAPPAGSWPYYRGLHMDGRYPEPINTAWPKNGPPELWRIPVGGGYASFVVGHGLAYTIEQRREQEVVAAYDVLTGVERWSVSWDARFEESMGGNGPRATPAIHGGTLFALGATGEFRALDAATGEGIWRTNILDDAGSANLTWGMAASPSIMNDLVLTAPGGPDGAVIAYELATGAIRWRALDAQGAYTAPAVFTLDGLSQIVLIGGDQVISLATDGSRTYWTRPWETMNGINAAQPLQVAPNRVFVSSGYGHGAAMLEVEADLEAKTAEVSEIWFSNAMKNKFSSSVLHEGYIYGLDEGILACIDPATGDRVWKGGRYGHGQVLLASGHLVITTERGHLVLVRATPEGHQEIAALPAVAGRTWNNPAIADGVLLVRNDREAVAFDLRPQT